LLLAILSLSTGGCTSVAPRELPVRSFDFTRDTFGYTNNNYWVYDLEAADRGPVVKERLDGINHGQRCTVMSRTARQFWYGARFDPDSAKVDESEYRRLIRRILATNPRLDGVVEQPIVIPGYSNLRELSIEREEILKEELGGRWLGYFQRGNWRMIFPFSPRQQRATAKELVTDLGRGHLPLVHVVNFPEIDINHTVLLFGYSETALEIEFDLYDPNNSRESGSLVYERASATFRYNRTDYFAGGTAMVYEVYDGFTF
jgi:hypothetical protein